ncbi:MAG: nitrile hydratase subunit beta [Notoacmeibacter sp.]|nr:nitrile hydratase subunit beta [Notoacmeibacter sp.]
MNGPQDLGGRMGFGAITPETDEPVFHAEWEKRALGVTLACGALGHWTLDESRHARESLHPADYYGSSYYEIWIKALEALLERHGELNAEELDAGQALQPGLMTDRRLSASNAAAALAKGGPVDRAETKPARFEPGDRIRTINAHPRGHTRLPTYAVDKPGTVEAVRGVHVFPDANAHGQGEQPQWLYTVRFAGLDLWGPDADPKLSVSIDAWEPYLEPA